MPFARHRSQRWLACVEKYLARRVRAGTTRVSVVTWQAMSIPLPTAAALPLTPCIGVCRLDVRGFCIGCQRTGAEIAVWRTLPDQDRLRYMEEILPAREQP